MAAIYIRDVTSYVDKKILIPRALDEHFGVCATHSQVGVLLGALDLIRPLGGHADAI